MTSDAEIELSVVVPVFNEAANVSELVGRVIAALESTGEPFELVLVDDGSADRTLDCLHAAHVANRRIKIINLTRNFGKDLALTAGIDAASGDAVIPIDADLQDPPEIVGDMVARWKEGFDIVHARRLTRASDSRFKRWTAGMFYKLLGRLSAIEIPHDVGDFRLIDRKVLEAFQAMPERDRFVRGMFAWLGFRQAEVTFHRPPRAAGETKYPFWKMIYLALNGVLSFSDAPLRLAIWLGLAVSSLAMLYGSYVIGVWFVRSDLVTGWSSTIVVISLLCGVNMLMTGIMGLYIGRIHAEVKRRPLYVVGNRVGFGRAAQSQPETTTDAGRNASAARAS